MLPRRLQEVRNQIESKAASGRTREESELLEELFVLNQLLEKQNLARTLREAVNESTQITSGPGGRCPCCGS